MYKAIICVALCIVAASARNVLPLSSIINKDSVISPLGAVSPTFRCGGVGTPLELRISGCDGQCKLHPGLPYQIEEDFVPSSAAQSLTLKVEVCPAPGFCSEILSAIIPNSQVLPGEIYIAKYSITPNDLLSGLTVEIRGMLFHTENLNIMEICVAANIEIIEII